MVELALNRIGRAALVKAEGFVAEIQSISHHAESFVQSVASLNVVLRVGVEVLIAVGTFETDDRIIRTPVIVPEVRVDAGVVVAYREAHREAGLVVGKTEVPVVRRLTWQGGAIGSAAVEFVGTIGVGKSDL